MQHMDEFSIDEDDTEFVAAATQVEETQNDKFESSPRWRKKRRLGRKLNGEKEFHTTNDSETDQTSDGQSSQEIKSQGQTHGQSAASDSEAEPETDDEYYFPGEIPDPHSSPAKPTKRKIHVPKDGRYFERQVFTQTQIGLDSSPSHFRGAVWKKPLRVIPSPLRATGPGTVELLQSRPTFQMNCPGDKSSTLIGSGAAISQPEGGDENHKIDVGAEPPKVQEVQGYLLERPHHMRVENGCSFDQAPSFDVDELADLPSDAFSTSSPERPSRSPEKDAIVISSQDTGSQHQGDLRRGPQHRLKQMTIFGQPATQELTTSQAAKKKHSWPLKARDEPPTHHKLNIKAMETWVYPTNLGTFRDYQFNIVSRSLFHNTLVALPTGLGKTFIAATVMLNYYRWTSDAQIVFMAPTKPLIAQQMEACYNIVGIPRQHTILMTGETHSSIRAEEWLGRRVFFMTPQTVINDLKTGICDPKKIVLVVVDEAHKATGSYAYTEVVTFLRRFNNSFRIQGLTATPGSKTDSVQKVIDNLGIARVELRTELSLDIRPYTHEKLTHTEIFDYSDEQELVMELISKSLQPSVDKLRSQNAYWSRDPMQLSNYGIQLARSKWAASDAGKKAPMPIKGMVNALFTVLASLSHSIGLLKFHGIRPFFSSVSTFEKNVSSGQTKGKNATEIAQSESFTKMMTRIRGWTNNPDFLGHPKLEYLRQVVLNHFLDAGDGRHGGHCPPSSTRIMIFASYRDSAEDICRILKRNEPMIRPHVFVGQGNQNRSDGMNQKRQNAVIQDFKNGKYNTLIATSIGEEGLDIGDVDLIVNYDATKSPIRMLQRSGRTGRKRTGRVVILLMKGKEENDYASAQDNYAYIQKTIADAKSYTYRDEASPRILPKDVQPIADKRTIEIPVENSQPVDLNEKRKKTTGKSKTSKRPAKKFHMPDGARTGFVKASKMGSDDHEEQEIPAALKKQNVRERQSSKGTRQPTAPIEPEAVELPFLEDVLLANIQQKELKRKYARTFSNSNDSLIQAPNYNRFPDALERLGPTKYLSHGKNIRIVEKTMRAIKSINDDWITRMKDAFDRCDLEDTALINRIATASTGPYVEADFGRAEDMPKQCPTKTARPKKIAEKRNPRPAKGLPGQTTQRQTRTADPRVSPSKERLTPEMTWERQGRPGQRRNARKVASGGVEAAEAEESSPEATPSNMRIGTQGIDLGSQDTSGEDVQETMDSELDDFIVGSDQPIEMASSSQHLPDDTQILMSAPHQRRTLRRKKKARLSQIFGSSDTERENVSPEVSTIALRSATDGDENGALPKQRTTCAARKFKRRIAVDSDSDA